MMMVQLTVLEFRRIITEEVNRAVCQAGFIKGLPMKEKFMDVNEAAAFLKVKPSTIHRRKSRGELLPIKKGGRLLFKESDLMKYLEGGSDAAV